MRIFKLFDIDTSAPPSTSERLTSPQQTIAGTKDTKPIYNPIAAQKEAAARQMEAYAAYQDAIHKTEQCKVDINKGIQAGESPYALLLKALECISLLTSEPLFYSRNREQIKSIYGVGLQKAVPLELELAEVRSRLQMLQRPELDAESADSKERIRQAVRLHKQREVCLLKLLGHQGAELNKQRGLT